MTSRLPVAVLAYAAIAAALVMAVHAATLHDGFNYDDYHIIRPHSRAEVAATFRGTWDATGIEVKFFRPLTVVLNALRFHVCGLNSEAPHATTLAMFWLAAWLFGLLARSFLGSESGGALAVAAFVVHPSMPYSAVAWITNQMHVLQLLVVLSALLWWCAVRRRGLVWWTPLLAFQAAAFMVKEDGVMLVPVILALHWLRRAIAERDLPHPPWPFIAIAAAIGGGLLYYRDQALHGLGGYGRPSADQAWSNYRRGFESVFRLVPARRPWQKEASWFVTIVPVLALACWRRCSPNVRFTLLAGIAIGALFNLPFIFVVKAQQMHLVGMGAALLITAGVVGLAQAVPSRAPRAAVLAAACAAVMAMALVSRDITRDFDPFNKIILAADDIVLGWAAVPLELREYLARKKEADASARLSANPAEAVDLVAFGLHARETDRSGRPVRWMSAVLTELYVHQRFRTIEIPLRHPFEMVRSPVTGVIEIDGRVLDRITFADGAWRRSSLTLRPGDVRFWRRMHRVVIRIDRTWAPADVIPGSQDRRTLGLQVGQPSLR